MGIFIKMSNLREKWGGASKKVWKNPDIKPPTIKNNAWGSFKNIKFTRKNGGVGVWVFFLGFEAANGDIFFQKCIRLWLVFRECILSWLFSGACIRLRPFS